ncbi:uncharacterized protein JCM6883_005267 [Sporobolomyces salmoneus]|uniref:uncharacterized protein n=1 Tax=Sporobolomyces salmoneus TaxID=183962 RepID=UPI00318154A7
MGETIYLSDTDDEMENLELQQAIEQSIEARSRTGTGSTSASGSSTSKKHSRAVDVDSDSDLELELKPLAKTPSRPATSTPSLSGRRQNQHKDKKPRVDPSPSTSSPRHLNRVPSTPTSSSSSSSSFKALNASIDSVLKSYASKRTTRPEYIKKKVEFRDEAKRLGLDFDETFGDKFDEVESRVTGGASSGKKDKKGKSVSGKKDIKGKGKAKIDSDESDEGVKEEDGTIDRRMTAAQVRAKVGGGRLGFRNRKPLPNDQILASKKREWEKANITPLGFGNDPAGQRVGGNRLGSNKDAMAKARLRLAQREAKRKSKAKKKGGIDGWIEGALAGPSTDKQGGGGDVPMPGGWGSTAKNKHDSDSDSSYDNSSSSEDETAKYPGIMEPGGFNLEGLINKIKGKSRGRKKSAGGAPVVTAASQELANFMRRNENALMRSTKAVDDAVAALGMNSQTDKIPGMKYPLLAFQWIGLAFMVKREMDAKVPGGILADEMGLGKTFQTIALMIARRSHDPEIRTNLVVVPLSLLSQWEQEIHKFAIGQSVHIYHGSNRYKAKTKEELQAFDVVITTHSTLSLEWPKSVKKKKKKKDQENENEDDEEEEKQEKKDPGILYQFCWYRVVIDEAHVARNPRSRISKAIAKLDSVFRWALTGTPMINTLQDYYPLHRFLRNKPWNQYKMYRTAITNLEKKNPVEAGRTADQAVGPLLLRRRKADELGGKPLVPLPLKTEKQINLQFDPVERAIYDHIEAGYQTQVNKFFREGTLLKNYHFILVLILRLEQLCCHPHLLVEKLGAYDREKELERAKSILGEVAVTRLQRQRLEIAVQRAQVDDLEEAGYEDQGCCPVCEEPIIGAAGEGSVTPCGHICCTTCIHEILNQDADDDLDGKKGKKSEAPCPLCRAPFSAKSLFDLECFEPTSDEITTALEEQEDNDDKLPEKEESPRKPRVTEEKVKPSARIVELSDDDDDDLPDPSKFFDFKPKIKAEDRDFDVKPKIGSSSRVKKEKEEKKDRKPRIGTPAVKDSKPRIDSPAVRGRVQTPSSSSSSRVQKKVKGEEGEEKEKLEMSPLVPSTKMVYILKKLRQYEAEDRQKRKELEDRKNDPAKFGEEKADEPYPDTRTIILSQFVAALDLLDRYLTENGIMSVRFQGSSSAEERNEAIELLREKEEDGGVKVMLLSTKAGGVGLNLTSACRVLSLDLAWSKAVEAQAFDRTYRLGQLRDVEIERIIVEDTIEERILNLQARKTLLSDMSLAEGQGDPDYCERISVPDILSLFRLDKHGNREKPGGGGGAIGDGTPPGGYRRR